MIRTLFFVLIVGYIITDMNESLQIPLNPFQYLLISHMRMAVPQPDEWQYVVMALLFTVIILLFSLMCRQKQHRSTFYSLKMPFNNGETVTKKHCIWVMSLFEWRKMWRKNLFKYISIIFLLFIIFGYYILSQETIQKRDAYFPFLHEEVTKSEIIKSRLDERLDAIKTRNDFNDTNFLRELTEEALAFNDIRKQSLENAIEGLESGNWQPLYECQLLENRWANGEFQTGNFGYHDKNVLGVFTIEASIAEKEWLMERNIQPVFSGEFEPNLIYAMTFGESHDNWREE